MHYVQVVHGLEALDDLNEHAPYKVLAETLILKLGLRYCRTLPLEILGNLTIQVTHVNKFHDDA